MAHTRPFIQSGICFALGISLASTNFAETDRAAQPSLSRIVVAYVAPPARRGDKVVSKIKRVYRAGEKFARIEQVVDAQKSGRNVIIVNQPDVWLSTSDTTIWQHSVNREQDLVTHIPIITGEAPIELSELEFGKELNFFARPGTEFVEHRRIRGIDCVGREYRTRGYVVQLYCNERSQPIELDVIRNRRLEFIVAYSSYEQDLSFETGLFQPPEGAKTIESSG